MRRNIFILLSSFVISLFNIFISIYLFKLDICVFNRGIAFGIRVEYEVFLTLFLILVLILLGIFIKGRVRYILFSLSLLGLSNLFVRVMYGSICDYIRMFNVYVNIVDILIVSLAILGGIEMLFKKEDD